MSIHNPLGETTEYIDQYAPRLLFPIARQENRSALGIEPEDINAALPFSGHDYWTLFELSWLNQQGLPQVAMATLTIDCRSPSIVESKSLKLYLNSWNQTKADNASAVIETIARDLSEVCGHKVIVTLQDSQQLATNRKLPGECIDHLIVEPQHYLPEPSLLSINSGAEVENQCLYSHLLKSNCPVTNQPDWATVFIEYSGPEINRESLLAYIVSYRQHQGFHENCVERIFVDIERQCKPKSLSVYARYTRRGGVDINPLRTNTQTALTDMELRIARQ